MATHFSIIAWRIPRTEESGGLQSETTLHPQDTLHSKAPCEEGGSDRGVVWDSPVGRGKEAGGPRQMALGLQEPLSLGAG